MFYEKKNIVIVKFEYRQIFFNRFIYLGGGGGGGGERERERPWLLKVYLFTMKNKTLQH